MVTDRDRRPPKGPTGSALLLCVAGVHCWDLLGVSRSMERNRHLLSIYPRILASIHCILSLIRDIFYVAVFYYMLMRVSCFGSVVSTSLPSD